MYWLSNWVWDATLYCLSLLLVVALLLIFKDTFQDVDFGVYISAALLYPPRDTLSIKR